MAAGEHGRPKCEMEVSVKGEQGMYTIETNVMSLVEQQWQSSEIHITVEHR